LGCTVGELLDRIDSAELSEWMAFFQLQSEGENAEMSEEDIWKKAFNVNG